MIEPKKKKKGNCKDKSWNEEMFSLGTQVVRNRTTTRTEIKSFKLFFSHFISSLLYPVHSFISVYRIQFLFSFNISITSYMTSLLHQRETMRFTHSFTCNCFFSNRYKSNEKLSNPKPKTHTHAQKEGIKIRIKLWFRSGFATVLPPIIVRQKSSQKGKKKGTYIRTLPNNSTNLHPSSLFHRRLLGLTTTAHGIGKQNK
jgi:hypothetical protein